MAIGAFGSLSISTQAEPAAAKEAAKATPAKATPAKATPAKATPAKANDNAEVASTCPPGAFCDEAEIDAPTSPPADRSEEPPAAQTVTLPPPRPGSDPDSPRVIVVHPDRPGRPGQVVVYEDGEMPPYWEGDPGPPPAATKRRSQRKRRLRRRRFNQKWGINLRLDGVLLPSSRSRSEDEGMGGIGGSVRYRPVPHLAFDAGVDYIGGIDANGYRRYEVPVGLNLMFFPNPHSLAQFYVFGGVNGSMAEVQSDTWQSHLANGTSDSYAYFGGQLGLGLEFRVSGLLGIHIDGLGFARTRTDDDEGGRFAEYISRKTGETTNSSAGGMLRIGVNFWW